MASSVLELMRSSLESAEKCEASIGEELDANPVGQKAKVLQQHRLDLLSKRIANHYSLVERFLQDDDGLRADEVANMRGGKMFESFYDKYQSTLEHYRKFENQPALLGDEELVVEVPFSGEEVFGKYLDLHSLFQEFDSISREFLRDQDYLGYLDRFNTFFYIPDKLRSSKKYFDYLSNLWSYLADFFRRINPLFDFEELKQQWDADFAAQRDSQKPTTKNSEPQPLRLGMFADVSELEALGMDRLKEALEAAGLKCGGTLKDRAERLWMVRGKKLEDIPNKLRATRKRKADRVEDEALSMKQKVAWLEFQIGALSAVMMDVIVATRRHAEKQQARTAEEKQAEITEEELGLVPDSAQNADGTAADEDDDDDNEAPIYNPLNLPLGWDGKPIPYWMYKLHGLGVEYKCEVCGNQSYWGRRAFDKHFQEWKHQYGMKCLGVPNTKHFHDICLIEDVLTLYSKIKDSIKVDQFVAEVDEEFEDTEGNVLNRRTYEDLARQGLL